MANPVEQNASHSCSAVAFVYGVCQHHKVERKWVQALTTQAILPGTSDSPSHSKAQSFQNMSCCEFEVPGTSQSIQSPNVQSGGSKFDSFAAIVAALLALWLEALQTSSKHLGEGRTSVGKWGSPNGYFYREKPVDLGVPKFQTSLINLNATPFLWFNIGSIHFGVRCWGCAVGGI